MEGNKTIKESAFLTDRAHTACFTGHRPEKLPFPSDDILRTRMLKSYIYQAVYDAVEQGYHTFITGMARGVDIWGALAVISFKASNPAIRLIGVSPYKSETDKLSGTDLWNYNTVLEHADDMVYIEDNYTSYCFRVRNKYMVDHSSLVIGVLSDPASGTGNTLRYAEKQGVETNIIDLNSLKNILRL